MRLPGSGTEGDRSTNRRVIVIKQDAKIVM